MIRDALVGWRWVVWSSKMTAPLPKQNFLFYLSVSEAFVMMGTTLLVFSFYLKKSHLHKTKTKGHRQLGQFKQTL